MRITEGCKYIFKCLPDLFLTHKFFAVKIRSS